MKNILALIVPLIMAVTAFINIACSSCKTEINAPIIEVKVNEINIWLNLMPGGAPSFHFSGAIEVKNNTKYDIPNLTLSEVVIIYANEMLHHIKPESDEDLNYSLNPDSMQLIKFYSPQNIDVGPKLYKADSLNVVLKFSCDEKKQTINAGIFPLERAH